MNKLRIQHLISENVKVKWECGDLTNDNKRLKKDFSLEKFKLGWNCQSRCIELWVLSRTGNWYVAASYNHNGYDYGRLYRHLRKCELNDARRVMEQYKSIEDANRKTRRGQARELAEQSGDYLKSKLNGRVTI